MKFEDMGDRAERLYRLASERDPRTSKYGLLMVDRSLGAHEIWCFLWFFDLMSLKSFFSFSYPFSCCAIDDDDEENLDEIQSLSKAIKSLPPEEEILVELSDYCHSSTSLIWWGTFRDLCSERKETSEKIRAEFRKPSVEEVLYSDGDWQKKLKDGSPLKEDEVDLFVEFVNNLKNV